MYVSLYLYQKTKKRERIDLKLKHFWGTAIALGVFLVAFSNNAFAQQGDDFEEIEANMDGYIEQLEEYLTLTDEGTLEIDPTYTELDIPLQVTEGIEEWIDYLNEQVINGEATINSDFSVSITDEISVMSNRSGVDVYWWGYNVFFNANETRTLYQSLKTSGGSAVGLSIIARYIPVPPTQLASAIGGAIGGGLAGLGQMIQDEHEGNGVRIRFTGLAYAAVPTGVFPQ